MVVVLVLVVVGGGCMFPKILGLVGLGIWELSIPHLLVLGVCLMVSSGYGIYK